MATTKTMQFQPYEWHDHHKPGMPRWRVKAGMAQMREALIDQMQDLSDAMENQNSFALVDLWHQGKQAILACEEFEEAGQ